MSNSFAYQGELISPRNRVDKDLICFGSKSEELTRGRDLYGKHFVGVYDFAHRVALVTVPEVDRRSLSTGDQFQLVVLALGHSEQGSILSLIALDLDLLLQIIRADSSCERSCMDQVRLLDVWKQGDDVLGVVVELDQQLPI